MPVLSARRAEGRKIGQMRQGGCVNLFHWGGHAVILNRQSANR